MEDGVLCEVRHRSAAESREIDRKADVTRELWEREPSQACPLIGEAAAVEACDTAVGNLIAKYGNRVNLVCKPAPSQPGHQVPQEEEVKESAIFSVDGSGAPRGTSNKRSSSPNYGVGRGGIADLKVAGHNAGWDNSQCGNPRRFPHKSEDSYRYEGRDMWTDADRAVGHHNFMVNARKNNNLKAKFNLQYHWGPVS